MVFFGMMIPKFDLCLLELCNIRKVSFNFMTYGGLEKWWLGKRGHKMIVAQSFVPLPPPFRLFKALQISPATNRHNFYLAYFF